MAEKTHLQSHVYFPQTDNCFPERKDPRCNRDLAVAISGGAGRSYSAAIGQVRGLMSLGIWNDIGALSCSSGSSWFSGLFYYASNDIPDETLLGETTVVPPDALSEDLLKQCNTKSMAYPFSKFTNSAIVRHIISERLKGTKLNRCFSILLGKVLLAGFNADFPNKYLAWKPSDVDALINTNPTLDSNDFQIARPNRPYLIANSTAIPLKRKREHMWHFEYSPLYCGTAQTAAEVCLGGGYTQVIGFNSTMESAIDENDNVSVEPGATRFSLCDMMGSSGAAPGSIFDRIHIPFLLPEFLYWPMITHDKQKTTLVSFVDGGDLDDTAIVPLLRRQFPRIIVFVNSAYPIGTKNRYCRDDIDGSIGRLFGVPPKSHLLNNQATQIFDNSTCAFQKLVDGLKQSKQDGKIPVYRDKFSVLPSNAFELPPYEPEILWFYNDLNQHWHDRLNVAIKRLLNRRIFNYHLHNFPNYNTMFQNGREAFSLNLVEIQLLANMWYWSLIDAKSALEW